MEVPHESLNMGGRTLVFAHVLRNWHTPKWLPMPWWWHVLDVTTKYWEVWWFIAGIQFWFLLVEWPSIIATSVQTPEPGSKRSFWTGNHWSLHTWWGSTIPIPCWCILQSNRFQASFNCFATLNFQWAVWWPEQFWNIWFCSESFQYKLKTIQCHQDPLEIDMYVRWYKATLLDSKKWTSMNGKVRELLSVKTASVKTPIDSHVDVIAHDDFAPFHQFRPWTWKSYCPFTWNSWWPSRSQCQPRRHFGWPSWTPQFVTDLANRIRRVGINGPDFDLAVRTWYLDHATIHRWTAPRLLQLVGQLTGWEAKLTPIWVDQINNEEWFEVTVVEPDPPRPREHAFVVFDLIITQSLHLPRYATLTTVIPSQPGVFKMFQLPVPCLRLSVVMISSKQLMRDLTVAIEHVSLPTVGSRYPTRWDLPMKLVM